jgi:hypothetical protein
MSDDNESAAVKMLRVCHLALTSAPPFRFHAGDNPCDFKLDRQDRASSYDLAARIEYVLKTETAPHADAPLPKSTTQQTVHVAVYEHRHGDDIRLSPRRRTSRNGAAKSPTTGSNNRLARQSPPTPRR